MIDFSNYMTINQIQFCQNTNHGPVIKFYKWIVTKSHNTENIIESGPITNDEA